MEKTSTEKRAAIAQKRLVSGSFTAGPWKADGYHVRQSGQRGTRMIADVCYTGPHHTPPDEYPKSCRLADEANARLIAAAPEMLEALERIREYQGRFGEDDPQSIAADILAKISSANVKEHATLSAGARVDHGVEVKTTGNHVNRAADRGCCVSTC